MIQYVILLPLFFSDGRRVPQRLFLKTYGELLDRFKGLTIDAGEARGVWRYRGQDPQERLRRVAIAAEDTDENHQFIRSYQETLKERFDQIDIWITALHMDDLGNLGPRRTILPL